MRVSIRPVICRNLTVCTVLRAFGNFCSETGESRGCPCAVETERWISANTWPLSVSQVAERKQFADSCSTDSNLIDTKRLAVKLNSKIFQIYATLRSNYRGLQLPYFVELLIRLVGQSVFAGGALESADLKNDLNCKFYLLSALS